MYSKDTLLSMNQLQVRKIASDLKIDKVTSMPKSQLVEAILAKAGEEKSEQDVSISEKRGRGRPKKIMPAEIRLAEPQQEFDASCDVKEGVLDLLPDGYAFLRLKNYENNDGDIYVSTKTIRTFGLRRGDMVKGIVKVNYDNKPAALMDILAVNGKSKDTLATRPNFDDLTPIYPDECIKLELKKGKTDYAIRALDLIAPIGRGQRAMIVSPPKAGKTTLLK